MSKRRNSSAKGAAHERDAVAVLHSLGYRRIHRAIRTPVFRAGRYFSNDNDVLGVFDIEAHCPSKPPRYVQVTVEYMTGTRKGKVEPVAADMSDHVQVEVWGWVGGRRKAGVQAQGFRVHRWGGILRGWEEQPFLEKVSDADD